MLININRNIFRLFLLIIFVINFISCGFYNRFEKPPAVYNSPLQTIYLLKEENKQYETNPLKSEPSLAPEIKRIIDRGYVTFAMTAEDCKPFYYTDITTGEFIGLDIELAYRIANRLGVKISFNRDSAAADEVIETIVNKKADIGLSGIFFTMHRAEKARFTIPYMSFKHAVLINRLEYAKIGTEKELPAFLNNFRGNIGITADSSYSDSVKIFFPHADIKNFDSWDIIMDNLLDGALLAAYRSEVEILTANTEIKDAFLFVKPVYFEDKRDRISMAVSADAPLLQEWLNIFIRDFLEDEFNELTPDSLIERHYGGS